MALQIGHLKIHNTMILAPLAGISDYPFRTVCREYGCELAYSEMVSSEGLVRGGEKTSSYLYRGEEEIGDRQVMGFQIFGSDPSVMADAAVILQEKGADIVDINMGCPVKKVVRSSAGSALLNDIPLMRRIVSAVRKRISLPFTVKIRAGWGNDVNAVEVSQVLEDCGVDAVTLHPRTRNQAFTGLSDWSLIKKVKESVKIPVIGNGDVKSIEDYRRMMNETNCDAVMVGRGAMGMPWIFRNERNQPYKPSVSELKDIILKHYRLAIGFSGEQKAIREMRKHISRYTSGMVNGAEFRMKINGMISPDEIFTEIERFFSVRKENQELCVPG